MKPRQRRRLNAFLAHRKCPECRTRALWWHTRHRLVGCEVCGHEYRLETLGLSYDPKGYWQNDDR